MRFLGRTLLLIGMASLTWNCSGGDASLDGASKGGGAAAGDGGAGGQGGAGGSASGGELLETGSPVSEDAFATAYAKARCGYVARCCADVEKTVDAASCEAEIAKMVGDNVIAVAKAAGAPYDGAKAGACVATLDAWPCNVAPADLSDYGAEAIVQDFFGSDDALWDDNLKLCGAYGQGALPAGSPCNGRQECGAAPGTYAECNGTPGVCVQIPYAKSGESCDGGVRCAESLKCLPGRVCGAAVTEGGVCLADSNMCAEGLYCEQATGTCRKRGLAGDSCSHGDRHACSDFMPCVASPTQPGPGTCAAPGAAGARCFTGDHCAIGLRCDGGPDSAGACAPQLVDGAACERDRDCFGGECGNSKVCQSNWECADAVEPFD